MGLSSCSGDLYDQLDGILLNSQAVSWQMTMIAFRKAPAVVGSSIIGRQYGGLARGIWDDFAPEEHGTEHHGDAARCSYST